MPVFQKLISFDRVFSTLTEAPLIINDLANNSEEDKENIKEILTTRYSSDMITLLPSCKCGATKGEYSVNTMCNFCNTYVRNHVNENIEPTIWFRKPYGVSKLISPIILIMLKSRFKKSGFSIIDWLIDTSYRATNLKKIPDVVIRISQTGIQRGYNNFVEHFDTIMNYLFSLKEFREKEDDYLKQLLEQNKDCIFADYIPIPNKSILIIEKTNLGVYVDNIIVEAVDAIQMLVSIDKDFHDQTGRVKENRTAKAISKLSYFYEKFYDKSLGKKTGQFRRHIFGSRTNFSFRAVITSLTDTHDYNTIEVPWGVGVTAFRPHLLNKLMKFGYSLNDSIGLLLGHVEKYHPQIDQYLQEIIQESPYNGITVIAQRNGPMRSGFPHQ